jgi:ketosteroid isomerase-like protein
MEGSARVSTHIEIVDAYMEGFRRSDKPAILALLTDDVAWDLPGFRHLTGKADFEGEIVNPQFEENPTLVVDRKVEQGDTVVCIGDGAGRMKDGEEFRFAFCDVFTFRDDLICRVESYVVPLTGPSLAELAD